MRAWFTAAATLALAAVAQTSGAADAAAASAVGSPEAGAAKAATCAACHGPNGNSVNPEWPVIAGQNAHYVAEQTRLIRDNHRPNPLMQPLVANMSDQDILWRLLEAPR